MLAARSFIHDPDARGPDPGGGRSPRRRALRSVLAAGFALLVMAVAAPGAMAAPWACDNAGYLTQFDGSNPAAGTVFNRADRQPNDTYQLNALGTLPAQHINALAFRPQDGFMYTFNNTTQEVTRIERDPVTGAPTFDDIGNPAGSGITLTVIGAVLANGNYLVWQSTGTGTGFGAIFDVSGPTAQLVTTVTLDPASPDGFRGDFAISPVDGQIYGVNPHTPSDPNSAWGVYRWTLSGNVLSRGALVADVGGNAFGGAWFQPDGTFIAYANGAIDTPPQGNGVYGINVTTGQMTFLGAGPAFSNADGTACANGLALTKDATPRTVTAGQEITYTHTMTSRALQDANVDFVDQLPAGLTFVPGSVAVSPQIGAPNNYGGTDTLSVSGTISPQQTVTITAQVRVSPDHACNVDVQNQSQATLTVPGSPPIIADSDDPTTPTEPTDPTIVHVNCSADVGIVKTANTVPIVPGEEATFTFVATNNGPSTAQNVAASDPLPAGFTFRSASPGCSEAGGTLTCTVGTLAPGATQTYTVTGLVASDIEERLCNTATVASTTPDPNAGNNSSTVCPPINHKSDLSIRKDASSATVGPNGQVMFTLVVENEGPSDDPDAEVNDPLVPGLTLVSAEASQGTCSTASNTLDCELGALKDGGSAQVLVTAQLTASTCVTNTAQVRGANEDPTPDNNQDSAQVCPTTVEPPSFDLAVAKSVNDSTLVIGQTATYRVVVRNNGPDTAENAVVPDTLNAPVTVVSVETPQGSCTKSIPMRCELGTIAAGDSVRITVRVKHTEATGCSPRQRNAASAIGEGTDTNPANNMDTVDVCVRKIPKLKITKVASREVVQGGDTFSYRIRVRNPSKGEATPVKVCDRLPSGLRYVSSKPTAKRQGSRQHCWTVKRLGAGKSKTFRVTVRAARGANGRKVNTATASSPDVRRRARARDPVDVRGIQTPLTG